VVMGNWTFTPDTLNRLASATNVPVLSTSTSYYCWSYDGFGNRTLQGISSAAFAAGPPACTPQTGQSYAGVWAHVSTGNNNQFSNTQQAMGGVVYDGAGNILNDGVNQYLYDGDGRICAVSAEGVAGAPQLSGYIYNAQGQRIAKGSITAWSCDPTVNGFKPMSDYVLGQSGEQVTEMGMDASGVMAWQHTNVYALGQLIATYDNDGLHFYLNDPLGTRRAQTDYAGVLEQTCASLPFGDALNCTNSLQFPTEHHFTGKERDAESGNDYFGARYFGSTMGRFMSPDWTAEPDPVAWADFENPQSLNLYSYVQNNPLSRTDAFGHDSDPCAGISNCASVTAKPNEGPPLISLGLAFGHHFVDQALVRSSNAGNSLAGQFFSRWRTGPLQNPGLHRGFTTAHRLNSAQIRQIIKNVEDATRRPMSQWTSGDIEQAVDEVRAAGGETGDFLTHIAENNPTARTVSADVQDIMSAAKSAVDAARGAANAIGPTVEEGVEEVEQCGPACIP